MTKATLVVEILHPSNPGWVTIRAVAGELGDTRKFICPETGERYRLENFAVGGGWRAKARGYDTIRLVRIYDETTQAGAPDLGLAVGMHLVGDDEEAAGELR